MATGADHRALGGIADFDDRDIQDHLPDRDRHRGIGKLQYDIQTIFIRPMPDQFDAVEAAIADLAPDAILVDAAFAGVAARCCSTTRPRGRRCSPPAWSRSASRARMSRPTGSDSPPKGGRARAASQPGAQRARAAGGVPRARSGSRTRRCARSGRPTLDAFVLDFSRRFDRFLQLSPAEFEYPRSDLSSNLRFVGTVLPPAPVAGELPAWWSELDGGRPVVHVTQGTIDNKDFDRLVRPTLDALADRDVLVVGRDRRPARWTSSGSCPPTRARRSSSPTTCCCRRPTCSSRTRGSAARSTR